MESYGGLVRSVAYGRKCVVVATRSRILANTLEDINPYLRK